MFLNRIAVQRLHNVEIIDGVNGKKDADSCPKRQKMYIAKLRAIGDSSHYVAMSRSHYTKRQKMYIAKLRAIGESSHYVATSLSHYPKRQV